MTDDEVYALAKLREYDGLRTHNLAGMMGDATAKVRRMLMRMEVAGQVRRNQRYSTVNDIYWEAAAVSEARHG